MDKESVLKIVEQFHQKIKVRGIKPLKLILYGSHASNTGRDESDIDLVVISDDFVGLDYWTRVDILAEVIYELFVPIEAVAMTQDEWDRGDSFVTDYASNGEVLFAA
jgi:predicted nucleotidyltransferase